MNSKDLIDVRVLNADCAHLRVLRSFEGIVCKFYQFEHIRVIGNKKYLI